MFRNQYDTDCTTWSPAGRIHQIEYALEAVKQGSAAIGLRSDKFALVATVKRSSSDLSSHQKKIFKIDDHVGIAIAGLVADARVLAKYMRTECINHRYTYDEPMQACRPPASAPRRARGVHPRSDRPCALRTGHSRGGRRPPKRQALRCLPRTRRSVRVAVWPVARTRSAQRGLRRRGRPLRGPRARGAWQGVGARPA